MRAEQLPHASRPVTERHRILIRILAERAVDEFLREVETEDGNGDQACVHHQETHDARR